MTDRRGYVLIMTIIFHYILTSLDHIFTLSAGKTGVKSPADNLAPAMTRGRRDA